MIRGHVFSEQIFSVDVFALFVNQFLGGNNGIVESYKNAMEMTNTANSITIKSGVAVVQGRYIEEHTETILSYEKTDKLYCSLVLEIDLSKTNTKTSLEQACYKILEGENNYPTLIQNDIANQRGNIYQFELARFQTGSTGITNFTDRRTYLDFESVYSGIIQDNLNSDSATSALSAKQGKILNEKIAEVRDMLYPVGTIYMSVNNTNPRTLFGGTWVAWGSGKVPIGVNVNDSDFNTVEKTGGSKTHKHTQTATGSTALTINQIPSHKHTLRGRYGDGNATGYGIITNQGDAITSNKAGGSNNCQDVSNAMDNTGGGQGHTHTNPDTATASSLQPYITCYMWKRTA